MAEREIVKQNEYEIDQVDAEQVITTLASYPNTRSLGGRPTSGKATQRSLVREVNRLKQQKETLLGQKRNIEGIKRQGEYIINQQRVELGNLQRRNSELERQISQLNMRNAELTLEVNRVSQLQRAKDEVIQRMRENQRDNSGIGRQLRALREANKDLADRHESKDELIRQLGEQLRQTNQLATSQASEIEHYKQFFATLQLVVVENNKYAERVLEFLRANQSATKEQEQ